MSGYSHPGPTQTNHDCHEVRAMGIDALRLSSPGDASWQLRYTGGVYMVDLPMEQVVRRYRAGKSTHWLAAAYGVAISTVSIHLKRAGVKLRGHGGNCWKYKERFHTDRDGYLLSYDRKAKAAFLHRACWEAYHGPIPDGHVVHHIDGDKWDNEIDNLACLTRADHIAIHGRKPNGRFGPVLAAWVA